MAEHECSQVSAGNISTFTTNISGKLLVEFLNKSIIVTEVLLKKGPHKIFHQPKNRVSIYFQYVLINKLIKMKYIFYIIFKQAWMIKLLVYINTFALPFTNPIFCVFTEV